MPITQDEQNQRRQFMQWLAASPLFALGLDQTTIAQEAKELSRNVVKRPDPMIWTPTEPLDLILEPE
jgi:(S)-2-hydroxy-acid oxidase